MQVDGVTFKKNLMFVLEAWLTLGVLRAHSSRKNRFIQSEPFKPVEGNVRVL
jgi:hypothetical protein